MDVNSDSYTDWKPLGYRLCTVHQGYVPPHQMYQDGECYSCRYPEEAKREQERRNEESTTMLFEANARYLIQKGEEALCKAARSVDEKNEGFYLELAWLYAEEALRAECSYQKRVGGVA